jgi:hypothetical protein
MAVAARVKAKKISVRIAFPHMSVVDDHMAVSW